MRPKPVFQCFQYAQANDSKPLAPEALQPRRKQYLKRQYTYLTLSDPLFIDASDVNLDRIFRMMIIFQ